MKQQKRILLIEDNPDTRLGLKIDLTTYAQARVWEAEDYEDTLRMLDRIPMPHLIITDLMMPSGTDAGLRLIAHFREMERFRYIPILVISARDQARDLEEALRLGATDYLIKPFELRDLLARVERAHEYSKKLKIVSEPSSGGVADHSRKSGHHRQLLVNTLNMAVLCWENLTGEKKGDLALKSGMWNVTKHANGSLSSRTMDRYLSLPTFPEKPKMALIFGTVEFVLQHMPEHSSTKQQLSHMLEQCKKH
ncbi:MAG: response regulator [SAR324 cluster bacterium]|nr:response regulator [SAR324 cluster bacterium]